MTPFILTVLKLTFLALLYFFVYRAIRVGVAEVRGQPAARAGQPARQPRGSRPARKAREAGSVVLLDENGKRKAAAKLNGTIQIGRAEACQIRLDDTYSSQFHARIFSKGDEWYVEDLGSTNGTYLNQRKVTGPTPIGAGDRVKIGKSQLEIRK
ncbi:MAG: FHA domain-containing protein [Actinobacteria bacterium]|nr:FHA domain-containing protein [Actinomycetota bacterium]